MTTKLNDDLSLKRIGEYEEQIARCRSDVDKVLLLVLALWGRSDENIWGFDGADVAIENGDLPASNGRYSGFIHEHLRSMQQIKKMIVEGRSREAA